MYSNLLYIWLWIPLKGRRSFWTPGSTGKIWSGHQEGTTLSMLPGVNEKLLGTLYHSTIERILTYCMSWWRNFTVIKMVQKTISFANPPPKVISTAETVIEGSTPPNSHLFDLLTPWSPTPVFTLCLLVPWCLLNNNLLRNWSAT